MNRRLQSHVFWGGNSPLASLAGVSLLILASSRFAYAVFCAGGLFWVYGLTALVWFSSRPILPKTGRPVILVFLTSFIASLYILLSGLINPLLILGTWFFLILIPPCCMGSGLFEDLDGVELEEALPRFLIEAACLGLLIIGLSLLREPLGLGSLSFPGGDGGIIELFSAGDDAGFFPIKILAVSGGGFLILGYIVAVYRFFRNQYTGSEDNK
jgi:hypothetical protein